MIVPHKYEVGAVKPHRAVCLHRYSSVLTATDFIVFVLFGFFFQGSLSFVRNATFPIPSYSFIKNGELKARRCGFAIRFVC